MLSTIIIYNIENTYRCHRCEFTVTTINIQVDIFVMLELEPSAMRNVARDLRSFVCSFFPFFPLFCAEFNFPLNTPRNPRSKQIKASDLKFFGNVLITSRSRYTANRTG